MKRAQQNAPGAGYTLVVVDVNGKEFGRHMMQPGESVDYALRAIVQQKISESALTMSLVPTERKG